MSRSRREVIAGLATAAVGSLAGCAGVSGLDTSPPWHHRFDEATRATAREVGVEAQRSVVRLHVDLGFGAKGTGWHVGDGQIVTNAHVLPADGSGSVEVTWLREDRAGSSERVEAEILGRNDAAANELDLGLLRAPVADLPSLEFEDSTALSRGDPLLTVGHPVGAPGWFILLGPFFQYGLAGIDDDAPWERNEQLASFLPTRQGNSGAPLLTLDGRVVGCHWGGVTPSALHAKDPDYVHTDFTEHRTINLSVHSATFEEQFREWR